MEVTMPRFYGSSILYPVLLILSAFLLHPSLSQVCDPGDRATLLQIKKAFNNPDGLSSWQPATDCCDWNLVECSNSNRITSVKLVDLRSLTGQIPPQIGNLVFLQTLDLHSLPDLVGPIPSSVGNLTMLRYLTISRTSISGRIPGEIGKLTMIESIDLSKNSLTGSIPKSIGSLQRLRSLNLDKNKLSGEIPESFGEFRAPDFYLDLSNNQLSGRIPHALEKKDFDYLDLSNNKLEGDVSPLFTSKRNMRSVDVSGNLLSFDVSKVDFPRSLAFLDLSENKIFGSLPKEMSELTNLGTLNVSYNRLCGKIPVGGNMQKFPRTSYFHNTCLCGCPLGKCRSLRKIFTYGLCLWRCRLSKLWPF